MDYWTTPPAALSRLLRRVAEDERYYRQAAERMRRAGFPAAEVERVQAIARGLAEVMEAARCAMAWQRGPIVGKRVRRVDGVGPSQMVGP